MIPRLTKRTLSAVPVGVFAALFALAAVLAVIGAAVAPAGVARGQEGPTVSIDGLVGELEKGTSDSFRVNATGLDTSKTYRIRIQASNAYQAGGSQGNVIPSNVGLTNDCRYIEANERVSNVSSTSVGRTLHACSTPGGTVTAFLYEGETSLLDHVFQTVAVKDDDPEPTPTPAPKAPKPQNFKATSTQNSVTLSWNAVTGATEYKLEWSGSSATGSSNISKTSHTVTGLTCNLEYTFKVSAKGDGATYSTDFGNAASVSGTTSTCPAAPAPSGFKATGSTQSTVTLAWTAVTDAEEYKLERSAGSNNWTTVDSAIPGATISYNVHSLVSCTSYQFRIRAKGGGSPYSTAFGSAADVSKETTGCVSNPPPTATPTPRPVTVSISGSRSVSRAENGSSVARYSATVSNGRSARWSLPSTRHATDRSKFSISSGGALSFRSAPDYENPTDSDTNNTYKVTVMAERSGASDSRDVTVTVTNVNEGPTVSGSGSITYQENGTAAVATYSATDPEGDSITSWSLPNTTHETDRSQFSISSNGVLSFRNSPDYETPSDSNADNIYKVTVQATSSGGTDDMDVTVTVTNVLEPRTSLALSLAAADSANIKVAYSVRANATTHNYKTELHTATSETGTYSQTGSALNSGETTRPTFANQTRDKWYKARTKNCLNAARTQCGLWSAWSSALHLKPKLAKPTELDIIPMPLRRAKLRGCV